MTWFLAGSSSFSWHDVAGLGDNHLATLVVSSSKQSCLLNYYSKAQTQGLQDRENVVLNNEEAQMKTKGSEVQFKPWKRLKRERSFIRIFTLCNSYWLLCPLQQHLQNVHLTGLNVWKHTSEKIWEKSGFLDWHRCNSTHAQVPNPEAVLDELGRKKLDFLLL